MKHTLYAFAIIALLCVAQFFYSAATLADALVAAVRNGALAAWLQ